MGDYREEVDFDGPDEEPDFEDTEHDSADLAEMRCPVCGGSVVEDTQKCPHCGDWITPTDPKASGGRRWVFVAAVVLMVVLMLMYAL